MFSLPCPVAIIWPNLMHASQLNIGKALGSNLAMPSRLQPLVIFQLFVAPPFGSKGPPACLLNEDYSQGRWGSATPWSSHCKRSLTRFAPARRSSGPARSTWRERKTGGEWMWMGLSKLEEEDQARGKETVAEMLHQILPPRRLSSPQGNRSLKISDL